MRLETAYDILMQDLSLLIDNTLDPDKATTLVSGGTWNDEKQPIPALYATQDLAMEAWINTVKSHIGQITNDDIFVRWVEKPVIDRYQITVMDTKDMHRLVNDRFSVYSKLALVRRSKKVE